MAQWILGGQDGIIQGQGTPAEFEETTQQHQQPYLSSYSCLSSRYSRYINMYKYIFR